MPKMLDITSKDAVGDMTFTITAGEGRFTVRPDGHIFIVNQNNTTTGNVKYAHATDTECRIINNQAGEWCIQIGATDANFSVTMQGMTNNGNVDIVIVGENTYRLPGNGLPKDIDV